MVLFSAARNVVIPAAYWVGITALSSFG